jgi:hypothetical protein
MITCFAALARSQALVRVTASYESWWSTLWSGSQPLLPSKLRQLHDGGGEDAGSSIRARGKRRG